MPGWPTPGVRTITLTPRSAIASTEGPYDLTRQTFDWGGERWEANVTLPQLKRATAAQWQAFLLAAKYGTFYLGPVGDLRTAQGVATGTPLVNGSNAARSKTLATKGWTHSITGILKAGDFIEITDSFGKRLHQVLKDANSDGSGLATLDIWPRIRLALSDGATISVSNPTGIFNLADPNPGWSFDYTQFFTDGTNTTGMTFTAVEAIS
jgi:hypothetical protein